ncbi:MAG: nicotinate (nicotinamide) nucleotide adenylyltransferase [bacterium]|nr:nicotinate (nicotinamide) nucleotide adenylyltransferase [bacterium]
MPGCIVYGGTFDPVHVGHLALAEFAREETGASRLLLVPARRNPLRGEAGASFEHRVAMLRIAVAGTGFEVDEREGGRPGPSYTVDTLEELAAESDGIFLLVGGDQLAQFRHWHRWERILALACLLVVNRPSWSAPPDAVPHRLLLWPGMELSAAWLRERIAHGLRCRHLLPPGVWDYVKKERLYR